MKISFSNKYINHSQFMTIHELWNSIIFLSFKTSLVIAHPTPQCHYDALCRKIDMQLTPWWMSSFLNNVACEVIICEWIAVLLKSNLWNSRNANMILLYFIASFMIFYYKSVIQLDRFFDRFRFIFCFTSLMPWLVCNSFE